MSKKPQPNRLDNLFKDIDTAQDERPDPIPGHLNGWYWECGLEGQYISCSSEVEGCLGVSPAAFQGQSIFTFHLHPDSEAGLRAAFQAASAPREVEVVFVSALQELIPARFNILTQVNKNGHQARWQGFIQLMPQETLPAAPRPVALPVRAPEPQPQRKKLPGTRPLSARGVAIEGDGIRPSNTLWTLAAQQSLEQKQPVTHAGDTPGPAAIAVPFNLRHSSTGIVEIVDDTDGRKWTEDERQLVQEVTNQLALALENADLYQTVQTELGERIRAEQEITTRNQDLATLNMAGQQLSRLTSSEEIFDLLSTIIGQLLGNRNLSIVQFDANKRTVSFPVLYVNGERQQMATQPLGNDLAGYLFWTKKSLLIGHNAETEMVDKGVSLPEHVPASVLAIPMLAGERPVGAIILQDFEREQAYSSIHVELLSTLASQATTALENANLFQEIRSALGAIENRERYQANVALVAATLSKYGSKSLPEVMSSLGEAAQTSRVYFAEAFENDEEAHWSVLNHWLAPTCKELLDLAQLNHILPARLPYVVSQLRETGWVAKLTSELPSSDRAFFTAQKARSVLILSVPGRTRIPGFIVFEQLDNERSWQLEEIRILQVATDALSNTILRENLLKQVQVSLHETENLYNISHNLALATDMQDMLATIAAGLQAPEINRCVLVNFDLNPLGGVTRMSVTANWYSGDGTQPPAIGSLYPTALYSSVFLRPAPAFIDDINDPEVDSQVRAAWTRENIRSIALLPLWAGKHQIGVLLLESEERQIFNDSIKRSTPSLVDQLATSIENLRLFQETEKALGETGMLYKISDAISKATDAQDLVMLIANNLMPAEADRVSLSMIDLDAEGEPAEIEIIGHYDTKAEYQRLGMRYPASMLRFYTSIKTEPLVVPDIRDYEMDDMSRRMMEGSNILSTCIVPLHTSGRLVGLIAVSSREPADFQPREVHNLQAAANGIAVALEKQRLLREAQRRAVELQTAAELARDTTSTLSLDDLLSRIVNLLCERFNFYHASIFLLDASRSYAVIRESTGEAGKDMKARGHKLAVGSKSIIGTVSATGEPAIINDTTSSPDYFANPLLPETRSEMGIPLKLGSQVIGALDIQSRRANAFSKDDVAVLQVLADQIAIAIDNARAYEMSQKAVEEIREVDRMKSQFLANMSHELRTPLNSIIGFSRVILKGIDGPISETQEQDLGAIYNSGQHLLNLINDILDLSKIEAGKMELTFGEVNLAETVTSVMSTATGLVKGKPVKLVQVVPADLPLVRADNTRVRQVLLNFISNASKFTDEGTITVEAQKVTNTKGRPEIMITVTDSGAGIAAEDTHKLFQPFSQVDDSPTRKTGGTGLGLSICRSMIEMHGGRIGLLRSEVGVGSTFFFTLPLFTPEPEVDLEELSKDARIVLAIDDDAQVISLYERYLKAHGYHVVALTDPKQAVERAKEIKPAAITLDIMMPDRDGWQVMRDLKNDPETRNIPIVICSILEEEEKGFNLGAADYLVKPFAQDDLINTISRLNTDGHIHQVLVIDDSPADLRLVQKMLEDTGHFQVTLAEGGQAGWDSIQASRPDVVILDLFMPGLNGFEMIERLRSENALSAIPVIVLTGADLTPEQQQQLAEFGQQLLAKGHLNEKELLSSLEYSLQQFHLIEANPPK